MMNAVAQRISREDIPLEIFDASRTHVSYILPSLWTKVGVMIGAPTYEVSMFPPVEGVLNMAAHKHIFLFLLLLSKLKRNMLRYRKTHFSRGAKWQKLTGKMN